MQSLEIFRLCELSNVSARLMTVSICGKSILHLCFLILKRAGKQEKQISFEISYVA